MATNKPVLGKKYLFRFEGMEYEVTYPDKETMESVCIAADFNHDPTRIGKHKIVPVSRFQIVDNVWCVYWKSGNISIVQIEDWNRMIVNAVMTDPNMIQRRESGLILESDGPESDN